MPVHTELGQLAIVALAALLCGMGLTRIKQPAIVGYIFAGIILGPSAFGLVENRENVAVLAELGVLLLLFAIGMKLSLRAFRTIYKVALLAAAMQIAIAVVITLALSRVFGWSLELSLLLGFVVSLSSTAVAIKMLEEIGELRTEIGRLVVGILIAQDLAVVPMLILLNGVAGDTGFDLGAIPAFAGAIAFLVLLVWYLSRKERIRLPFHTIAKRHPEIAPLAALTYCFALAALSGAIGLTAAYGAFIAGLFIGSTSDRRHMIRVTEPIEAVLVMVFFLSIGLLIDLAYIWQNIGTVVVMLVLILLVKSVMNIGILRLLGEPWPSAFLSGIALSQVGEFSFVLAGAGVSMAVMGVEGYRMVVSVIALSLIVSPLWLETARRLQKATTQGVSRFDDVLLNLYEEEVRAVAAGSKSAVRVTYLFARLMGGRARRLAEARGEIRGGIMERSRALAVRGKALAADIERQVGNRVGARNEPPTPINDDEAEPEPPTEDTDTKSQSGKGHA